MHSTVVRSHLKALHRYNIAGKKIQSTDGGLSSKEDSFVAVTNPLAQRSGLSNDHAESVSKEAVSVRLPQADQLFGAYVDIGTPSQRFLLEVDTGSPLTWVFSTEMPKREHHSHRLFDPSKSSSFQGSSKDFKLPYQDDSFVEGSWAWDLVKIDSLTLPNTAIGVAKNVSSLYIKGTMDGILGLTLKSDVLNSILDNESLKQHIFTLRLTRDGPGELTLGSVDTRYASSNINYVPLSSDVWKGWKFPTNGIKVQGRFVPRYITPIKEAVIDSGTALLYLHPTVVQAVYDLIPGSKFDKEQEGYVVPVGSIYPSLTFLIGGQEYQIPSRPADKTYTIDKKINFGEVQSTAEDDTSEYYGAEFLKYVLAVHDFGNKTIGFAKRSDVKYDEEPAVA